MIRAGVIGLGDMGSGIAKNLIKNGFVTTGFDIDQKRLEAFAEMGGTIATDTAEVGRNADVVFVMVMTGARPNRSCLVMTTTQWSARWRQEAQLF